MKLATFTDSSGTRVGVVQGDGVVDLASAAPDLPREMTALLGAGPDALAAAARASDGATTISPEDFRGSSDMTNRTGLFALEEYEDVVRELLRTGAPFVQVDAILDIDDPALGAHVQGVDVETVAAPRGS